MVPQADITGQLQSETILNVKRLKGFSYSVNFFA